MKEIIIIGIILIGLLSGCIDRTGYKECFNSYDNLILKDGYKIVGHKSDFLSGNENAYMVIYKISFDNKTFWTNVFTYVVDDDRLVWVGDNGEWDLPYYIIKIDNKKVVNGD